MFFIPGVFGPVRAFTVCSSITTVSLVSAPPINTFAPCKKPSPLIVMGVPPCIVPLSGSIEFILSSVLVRIYSNPSFFKEVPVSSFSTITSFLPGVPGGVTAVI